MTPARVVGVPIEHIDAELIAAPLVARGAFESTLTALDPGLAVGTATLWRATERDLLARFPGMSVDELVLRRDGAWFESGQANLAPVPLASMLRRTALSVVSPNSGMPLPVRQGDRGEVDQRRTWRWLTFSLPADLLLAAAGARAQDLSFVSPRMQARLDGDGVAEVHLHLKAALRFTDLWASAMAVLAEPDTSPAMLASPGAEWSEGRELASLLLQCALMRQLLGAFLARGRGLRLGFRDYLRSIAWPGLVRLLGTLEAATAMRAVADLDGGRVGLASDFARRRHVYALLTGRGRVRDTGASLDPLRGWFVPRAGAEPDFQFTAAACSYLLAEGRSDHGFARLFWQTVRGRVAFYRHVVQRPMTPGLQWFIRAYGRLASPRRAIPLRAFVGNASAMSGPGLRSLEVRLSPDDRFADLVRTVRTVDGAARQLECEFGVVFHFSRVRGDAAQAGHPTAGGRGEHDDPSAVGSNPSGYRFSGYYRSQRTGAVALANLLYAFPRSIEIVRGVDLCTDELGVPLWVLRHLLQHVLDAGERASAWLARYGGRHVRPLGMTVHAGEDFVHLLGGIRRIAETVEVLSMGEGSRLGHAVALGIDVQMWAERVGSLRVPRGERMADLLWAWRAARNLPGQLRTWLPVVERDLVRIGRTIFGRSVSAAVLSDWWTALHDPRCLRAVGFPDGPPTPYSRTLDGLADGRAETLSLLHSWLTGPEVFERSRTLELVDVRQEVEMTDSLQQHVRRVVAERSIVVEVNPSSNLLIGHLVDLTSHPLWRLCPPAGAGARASSVRVAIGSDDPITFATTLPEEYQLVADALMAAGVEGPEVDQWLSAAQRCGMLSRFTVPRSGRPLHEPTRFDPPTPI